MRPVRHGDAEAFCSRCDGRGQSCRPAANDKHVGTMHRHVLWANFRTGSIDARSGVPWFSSSPVRFA
jgi:hypothetical protein